MLILVRILLIRKAHLLTEFIIAVIGIAVFLINGLRSSINTRIGQTVFFSALPTAHVLLQELRATHDLRSCILL